VRVRSVHSWDAPGLVLDGVAHLALISGPAAHAQIEPVATFWAPLVLVAAPSHPLVAQQPTLLADLARHQALVSYWGPASRLFWERVRAALPTAAGGEPAAGAAPGPWMELSPVELVKGMLVAGSGVSLVPAIAVQRELASGELVRLALGAGERLPEWEITLIRHRRRPPHAAADALAETLMRVLPGLIQSP
jgi:DNA-binding transcriptional LysR family regulator